MSEKIESYDVKLDIMEPIQSILLSQLLVQILVTNDNIKELTDKINQKNE